jgi:hypothetical protein
VTRPTLLRSLRRSEPFRVFQLGLGGVLIVFGPIIGLPTPGPLGFILFGFGAALVLRNSAWVRRRYVRYARRYPRVRRVVNFGLRRKQGQGARAARRDAAARTIGAPAELTKHPPPPTSPGSTRSAPPA